MKNKYLILLVIFLLTIGVVNAATLSAQLKRTNPGIAGKKSSTLIYDIVNMDTEHMVKGFIVCMSPDDAKVTSSYGAGTGTGAQYVSPFITMDKGPYQGSMILTIESSSVGDKNAGCIFKYIPYKEVTEGGGGGSVKVYLKMDGEYVTELKDMYYRELRLDKTAPFITGMEDPQCPEGQAHCKANEVIDMAAPTPSESPTTGECNGCLLDGVCVEFGFRREGKYCDITKEFHPQKDIRESCDNDFECTTNTCSKGICIDIEKELKESINILKRIWCKLIHLFNHEAYNSCLFG